MTAVAIFRSSGERPKALKAAFVAFTVGATLVFITGFSHVDNVHNAAHEHAPRDELSPATDLLVIYRVLIVGPAGRPPGGAGRGDPPAFS